MALRPGTIIDDTWVIEHPLGAGGMGSVYRAHNRHAKRIKAAIKMLSQDLLAHEEANTRFVREAEILFDLDHPHIVKVRNVRLEHVPPYIEMEFVEGMSLYKMLAHPPFPFERALLFAEQLASAVRYLHRHNVYHRDIKPSNLLVRKGTVLKLVDFGLAVDMEGSERITQTGAHFGTVSYAPPEWIRPSDLDPKAWDLYAIGVILHEMLTGDVAFEADTGATPRQAAIQIMAEKQALPYLDPGPAYPDSLRNLVRELTARDPKDRIQDARDIITRLQRIQEELSFNANTVLASGLEGDELQKAVHERYMEVNRPHTMHDGAAPRFVPELGRANTAAAMPAHTSSPSRVRPRMWLQLALAGVVGFVLMSAVALFTAGTILAWRSWTRPQPREVTLLVTGVPRTTDIALRIGDHDAVKVDGLQHHFEPLIPGDYVISWSTGGPGCGEAPCPGEGCSDTCQLGEALLSLVPGSGVISLPVELSLPEVRDLSFSVPDAPEGSVVRVAGQEVAVIDDVAVVLDVPPGDHEVEVVAGACVPAARGCAAAEECPTGCSSAVAEIHVPNEGDVVLPELSLPAPTTRRTAPRSQPVRAGGKLVTRGAFVAWLAKHPEWSPERATADGRADGAYLQGVDLGAGGSGAVVSVPWGAAQAYCSGRGGLLALDAKPLTWSEGSTGLFQEWRSDGGSAAWRRYDGASSPEMNKKAANAFTGFRCRR